MRRKDELDGFDCRGAAGPAGRDKVSCITTQALATVYANLCHQCPSTAHSYDPPCFVKVFPAILHIQHKLSQRNVKLTQDEDDARVSFAFVSTLRLTGRVRSASWHSSPMFSAASVSF